MIMKINNRLKKLIGTIIIPIWLIIFIGIVALLAEILLPNLNGLMVFLFYLISGLILDYWNITSNDHGPVAYCYYGKLGNKPRGLTTDILPSAIMGSNSNNKRHYENYRFWDQSISGIRPMAANS